MCAYNIRRRRSNRFDNNTRRWRVTSLVVGATKRIGFTFYRLFIIDSSRFWRRGSVVFSLSFVFASRRLLRGLVPVDWLVSTKVPETRQHENDIENVLKYLRFMEFWFWIQLNTFLKHDGFSCITCVVKTWFWGFYITEKPMSRKIIISQKRFLELYTKKKKKKMETITTRIYFPDVLVPPG